MIFRYDPENRHKIRPILIGPDSIPKEIGAPFPEPLLAQEPFDMMVHCRLPAPTYRQIIFKIGAVDCRDVVYGLYREAPIHAPPQIRRVDGSEFPRFPARLEP